MNAGFGVYLREILKSQGISEKDLADAIMVTPSTISMIIKDAREVPDVAILENIMIKLDLDNFERRMLASSWLNSLLLRNIKRKMGRNVSQLIRNILEDSLSKYLYIISDITEDLSQDKETILPKKELEKYALLSKQLSLLVLDPTIQTRSIVEGTVGLLLGKLEGLPLRSGSPEETLLGRLYLIQGRALEEATSNPLPEARELFQIARLIGQRCDWELFLRGAPGRSRMAPRGGRFQASARPA